MSPESNLKLTLSHVVEGYFKDMAEAYHALQSAQRDHDNHQLAYDENWSNSTDASQPMSNAEHDWHIENAQISDKLSDAQRVFTEKASLVASWWTSKDIPF